MKLRFFCLLLFAFQLSLLSQISAQNQKVSLIDSLIYQSKNTDLSVEERITVGKRAQGLAQEINNDTLELQANWSLSRIYLYEDLIDEFGAINIANLKVAESLNDSTYIAYTHQNLGYYYDEKLVPDSSYYHYYNSVNFYEALGDIRNRGEVLFNIANLQVTQRDYVGGERNAIRSLRLIQTLPKTENNLDTLYWLYNLLAIISNRIENYEDSIQYHLLALETSAEIKNNLFYELHTKNNLGYAYQRNEEYEKALNIYDEILGQENLLELDSDLYIMILGNIAFTNHLANSSNVDDIKRTFNEAYKISDSLNNNIGKLRIGNDMAEFYLSQQWLDSSKFFAYETLGLAKEYSSNENILRSLKLLSKVTTGEEANAYLEEHIKLSDSLLVSERKFRERFARIEFQTDQLKAEKEKATRERQIFMLSSIGLLVMLFLLYIIITQRAKNRELAFTQQQQEANEEIYNLMLAQQDKIEEGRTKEKKRISEELHDGVLGRLFGTRLSLDSLNLQNTDDAVKTRGQYIEELKSIEQEIRKISHDLNTDFISGSSFSDIIRTLVENQTQAYQLKYQYHEDETIDWDALSNKTKIHVYRMLQETMQNTYKHANATTIKISFEQKNNVILLTVVDDGKGFNLNKARKGIGLKNFESRAKEINGKVDITSQPGEGTKVLIEIPSN